MVRASVDWSGWRWRQDGARSNAPVTNEQLRQTAQSTFARRVTPLFGLDCVAALGQDRKGSNHFAQSLPKPKSDCSAGHPSISTGP